MILLLPHLTSDTGLVRLRNALLLAEDFDPAVADWQPPAVPAGFLLDRSDPYPMFRQVVQRLALDALPDDWSRAQAISAHLLGSAPQLLGGALKANLQGTYHGIIVEGQGYCGDFVRVFGALAQAAGMQMRAWSFAFDEFGGHGHILVEIWNRQVRRWQLVDIFNNYYFTDGGGPLSVAQLRAALLSGSPDLKLHAIDPRARPGFEIEARAWDYYHRGLHQWYLNWGLNPFDFDRHPTVRLFAGRWRTGEHLAAIATGVYPPVRMLADPASQGLRADMWSLKRRLPWCAWMAATGGLLLALGLMLRERPMSAAKPADQGQARSWPRVCLVGPLPPPSGGMANQCEQLMRLLAADGADVRLVRTNAPYRPAFVGRLPLVRALARLLPYLVALWNAIGRSQVVHVFANSGWAWHLMAFPALLVARLRGVPAIVNYRGGLADEFLSAAPRWVHRSLRSAALRVTPSAFLLRVFARHGMDAQVIPNIIDLTRFRACPLRDPGTAPHLIVTRNLEPIYDIPTALRAFVIIRGRIPGARLTVAGTGPERAPLEALAASLGVGDAVHFPGRIANEAIGALYADADLMLNPTTADNMPISILEALASGLPVVSTNAGGIPDLVQDGTTAMLVPVGQPEALAAAALSVLQDRGLARRLSSQGVVEVQRYAWPQVRDQWRAAYVQAVGRERIPQVDPVSTPPGAGA